ncbi:MAG TPA: 2OG-Fe(II) oxygenase [Phenylobacterium sp.]
MIGARSDGGFYSSDVQAGRPVLIVPLGGLEPDAALGAFGVIAAAAPELAAAGIDVAPIAPPLPALVKAFTAHAEACERVIFVTSAGGLDEWTLDGAPGAVLIDRGWRIVEAMPLTGPEELLAVLRRCAERVTSEPPGVRITSAPVLVIPNVASRAFCEALIAHFEASPHQAGVMAGFVEGAPYAKLDESKKRRRDLELTAESPLYAEAVALLSTRIAPEIKRAFQVEIANADRLLIARYDDDGGYFKRHRDNAAPHTAFREFAISLNLNTQDYEGGELLFPEFNDDRISPPAGSAIIFSASLLHEVSPVTRGSRYVLLSFLGSALAQSRLNRWLETQASAQASPQAPASASAKTA